MLWLAPTPQCINFYKLTDKIRSPCNRNKGGRYRRRDGSRNMRRLITHFVPDVVVVVVAVVDGRLLLEQEGGEVGRPALGSQTRHLVAV